MLEKTLESSLDCREIKSLNPKGNQPWKCIGRTDAEAETPILWPSDVKSRFIGKDPDAGKDWGQEEKGATYGWMASLIQWTWVWTKSKTEWRTEKPGMLQPLGLQSWTQVSDWTTKFSQGHTARKWRPGSQSQADTKVWAIPHSAFLPPDILKCLLSAADSWRARNFCPTKNFPEY